MPAIREYGVQDNDRAAYQVHVYAPEHGVSVRAYIPEQIEASLRSNYDTPFAEGFIRNLPHGERLHLSARLAGYGTTTQIMSMQVWQGSEPMSMSLPVHFLYRDDVIEDVIRPMKALMSLSTPRSKTGSGSPVDVLESPGPRLRWKSGAGEPPPTVTERIGNIASGVGTVVGTLTDAATGDLERAVAQTESGFLSNIQIDRNISIDIGDFMSFDSVIIPEVSSTYEIKLDRRTRRPIALEATIQFITFLAPTVESLDQIFGV